MLIQHRKWTLQTSVSTNPHFFFAAFPGLVVSTAAHNFVAHFFVSFCFDWHTRLADLSAWQANHSSERPEGYLDQSTLKSFFSITGDTVDTLKWVPGQERIRELSSSSSPTLGAER